MMKKLAPYEAVEAGYNANTDTYLNFITQSRLGEQRKFLNLFLEELEENAKVLDIGCGAGLPTTKALSEKFDVVGIDLSLEQIKLAQSNVPLASFQHKNIVEAHFDVNSFRGIIAFYSLFHIPRDFHESLFKKLNAWLEPAGIFLATFLAGEHESLVTMDETMRNAPMFLSGTSPEHTVALIENCGFEILKSELSTDVEHDGSEDTFFWVFARKL
ncbi:MAG: class I SAM-dependent methyltransferase [Bdellovibrionales bacterium]|nr:class I SAM-dependent methyltransferase [Bdellovibrionales bacterium]